jgi:hypothetical protein
MTGAVQAPLAPAGSSPAAWARTSSAPGGPPPEDQPPNSWLVVLTIGLAALVLAMVVIGLQLVGGRAATTAVVEVPPRGVAAAPTNLAPATTGAPGSPTTTVPGATSTTLPKVDTTTLRVKVTDPDGRFEVTVPRSWVNLPTPLPDENQWEPTAQKDDGSLVDTPFLFGVRWAPAEGCALADCATQVVNRFKAANAGADPVLVDDTVGRLPAKRFDVTVGAQRFVAWIVAKGDRYWVPQLRGPTDTFEAQLAVVVRVVAAMSFS